MNKQIQFYSSNDGGVAAAVGFFPPSLDRRARGGGQTIQNWVHVVDVVFVVAVFLYLNI